MSDGRGGIAVVAAAAALALAARLIVITAAGASPEPFEYDTMVRNLLMGRGYVYDHLGTEYRAFSSAVPYVLALAAGYALTGGAHAAALGVQALASAALVVTVYAIACRLGGRRTAAVAAILVALHPALVFYDTRKIHPLGMDALAIALVVLTLLRLREAATVPRAALGGLAFGLALLHRPTVILVPLFALAWLAVTAPAPRSRLARTALVYALFAAVVVAPWLARNWAVLGTPIMSSVAAESLWRGNAPHSLGGSYIASGETVLETAPAVREALRGRSELEQAAVFRDAALADAAARPGAFVAAILRKLGAFWTFGPAAGVLYPTAYLLAYAAYYVVAVALAVVGVVTGIRGRAAGGEARAVIALIAGVALCVSVVQSVFYVETRHRWGVEPLVLVLTALGVTARVRSGPRP